MDDQRFQQFFAEPQPPQQRRYEAIRAVVVDGLPPRAVATRFGFAYGTLRNLIAQFRTSIRQGRTPPFSLWFRAGDLRPTTPRQVPIGPPAPIADCSPWTACNPSVPAWPDSFCFCLCSPNSASIASSAQPATPAHA